MKKNRLQSALPDWPRTERSRDNWFGLHKQGFFFTHEPSYEVDDDSDQWKKGKRLDDFDARSDYFCIPSTEYRKLRSVLENSKGGSVLITGYRGTGKSSLVKYTLHRLKEDFNTKNNGQNGTFYLDIRLNLSSVGTADQVLPMMFKAFYEATCVQRQANVPGWVRKEIEKRYQNTLFGQKKRLVATLPIGFHRSPGMESELHKEKATVAEMQDDLFRCIDLVFGYQIKTVFVFDEIDKLQSGQERSEKSEERLKQLQNIVGELKFILTESNAYHIFVAGKDVDDSWQEDQNKGEGLFESIFTLNIYLSSFFTPRLEYTLGPHRAWVLSRVAQKREQPFRHEKTIYRTLFARVFKEKSLRWTARALSLYDRLISVFLTTTLSLLISIIVWSILIWLLKFDIKDLIENVISKKRAYETLIFPSLLFLPSTLISVLLTRSFLQRNIPQRRSSRLRLTRLKKPQFKKWIQEKNRRDQTEIEERSEREIRNQLVAILASELGISRKTWSFRTALLILPHLAEYEIKGILLRRLTRIDEGRMKRGLDCDIRKTELEAQFLRQLVGNLAPLTSETVEANSIPIPSERKLRRLRLFIQYATYKGRGIPRKILREFYSFVRHRSIVKERDGDVDYWDRHDDVDFLFDIPFHFQQKMSFFADITSHLERHLKFFRNLDDKGIVSTFHIVDFILKFYETGFNRRDIYNANFMVRRLELFPSEALVERVLDLFTGFLITPMGRSNPEYRLLPRVQADLAKLYLGFGPDQLELRFTKAEFLNELEEIQATGSEKEGETSMRRIDSFRIESRRGRIFELIGDYFEARKSYSKAVRWVFEDFDNILERDKSRKGLADFGFVDQGRMLSFTSQAMNLLCRLARVHDVMHEFQESLLYCNQAIGLGLEASGVFKAAAERTKIGESTKRLLQAYPTFPEISKITDDDVTIIPPLEGDSPAQPYIVTPEERLELPQGSSVFAKLFCLAEENLQFFTSTQREGEILPEIKKGEPAGLVDALNASSLLHEKLQERTTTNESLLLTLFYTAASRTEYAFIDQLIFMGNLSVRRRDIPQALTSYYTAITSLNRIRYAGPSRGLPVSQRTRALLLCYIADLQNVYKSKDQQQLLESSGLAKDGSDIWTFLVEVGGQGLFDTREDEFLYSIANEIFEEIGDQIGMVDTHLRRLDLRVKRLRRMLSDTKSQSGDSYENFLFQEAFSSVLSGSCAVLRRLVYSTTERGRLDPTAQSDTNDQRRLGRLFEVVSLTFQLFGEYKNDQSCLILENIYFKDDNTLVKEGAQTFQDERIEDFRNKENTERLRALQHDFLKKNLGESLSSDYLTNSLENQISSNLSKAAKRTLDLKKIRRNTEILLSFILSKEVSIDDTFSDNLTPQEPQTRLKNLVDFLRPGQRSLIWRFQHHESQRSTETIKQFLVDSIHSETTKISDNIIISFMEKIAERSLLFSTVVYRNCIPNQGSGRACLLGGRFYLRNLIDLIISRECSEPCAENTYRELYNASKRFLVKSVDIFTDVIGLSRKGESLLGEAYASLTDLMILRRVAMSKFPQWHCEKNRKNDLKEMDDYLTIDVQSQAFQYAEKSISSYIKEVHSYQEGYPLPNSVHFSYKNLNDPLLHSEICASVARRLKTKPHSSASTNSNLIDFDSIPVSRRAGEACSLRSIADPQGTRYRADIDGFLEDFHPLLASCNTTRTLSPLLEIRVGNAIRPSVNKYERCPDRNESGAFFQINSLGEDR